MRTPTAYDKDKLKAAIQSVDPSKYSSLSGFCEGVADTPYCQSLGKNGISGMWVRTKLAALNLTISGFGLPDARTTRPFPARNTEKKPRIVKAKSQLFQDWGVSLKNNKALSGVTGLVSRILQGSRAAAVKAKCIDCCHGDRKSIYTCTIQSCPLWGFRPRADSSLESKDED